MLVDDELLAAVEQVEEGGRPVRSHDGDGCVDLRHREPTTGRGDRVALSRVRLLAYQQLVAGGLPGVPVDDRWDGGRGRRVLGEAVLVGAGHALLHRSEGLRT
ncbi:hypothetical protein BJF90_10530 [Pseudonocardia sp. CNS-004]|nr:hypothetical protein BJF90_10530 [Pseudonocardia sp. CNS-004]